MSSSSMSSMIYPIVMFAMIFLTLAAMWRLFAKAGEPGWKCIVPVYGAVVLLRLVGRPWWWLLLLLVPVVNLFPSVMLCFDLAKAFGKGPGTGFGVLLLGPIFIMWLAFSDARYVRGSNRPVAEMRRAA
jgi:hypothetical protein